MSDGRRRSSRLIQSPWLHNWPKKRPIYINLESGSTVGKKSGGECTGLKSTAKTNKEEHNEAMNRACAGNEMDELDVRSEWSRSKKKKCNTNSDDYELWVSKNDRCHTPKKQGKDLEKLSSYNNFGNTNESSDDNEDFVTPREYLVEKSNTTITGENSTKRKSCNSAKSGRHNEKEGITEEFVGLPLQALEHSAGVLVASETALCTRSNNMQTVEQNLMIKGKHETKQQKEDTKLVLANKGKNASGATRKNVAPKDTTGSAKKTGNTKCPRKIKVPKKVPRIYNEYIQKKFSPSIMTDVITNLSSAQIEWARKTGFGELLNFRMECYTHKLGYNVVNAFNSKTCSVNIKAGSIKVDEKTVNQIYGLPMGKETITFSASKSSLVIWAQQFSEEASSKITPIMVRDKILESPQADEKFKWNFLILFYNFFVESNQNSFLRRDILNFSGNINKCGNYNWCRLVIDKLKKTHEYWASDQKRNFAGSLPLLIYLYACTVRNTNTVYVLQTHPAYRGWSDMMLKQRQKHDIENNCFGEGSLVELTDKPKDTNLLHHDNNIELTLTDLVDKEEGRGNEVQEGYDSKGELPLHTTNQNLEAEDEINLVSKDLSDKGVAVEISTSKTNSADELNINLPLSEHLNDHTNEEGTEEMDIDFFDQGFDKPTVNETCLATDKGQMEGANTPLLPKQRTLMSAEEYWQSVFGKNKHSRPTNGSPTDMESEQYPEKVKQKLNHADNAEEQMTTPTEVMQQCTQKRMDEEIDKHFEEEAYVTRFEQNLKAFVDIYERCLTEFEVTYALYNHNPRIAELKTQYGKYIHMFAAESPITKNLPLGIVTDNTKNKTTVHEDVDYIPSYSLGISQVTPKNLETEMEGLTKTKMAGALSVSTYADKGLMTMNEKLDASLLNETSLITRPRRETRTTEICRSPYVSRVVDISGHTLTMEEKNVWSWLFENKRNRKDSLFNWNGKKCTKAHFQSMFYSNLVETTVIDTWTYLLNENENLRSNASPLRLFMTTETTLGPLSVNVPDGDTEAAMHRDAIFCDNMDVVMATVEDLHKKHYDVNDYDLFFFPVYQPVHHFVICYNTKTPRWDIIDNRVPTGSLEDMYGDLPERLHACFCQWISIYNIPKYDELVKLRPRLIRTGWQTESNMVDCGIFAMRHLETYMGNLLAWRVGLRTEKENQITLLNKLRLIYTHQILTWTRNENRRTILESAARLASSSRCSF